MAQRVVLHVGLMKSGTSFVQDLLFAAKAELGAHGVLVPGAGWGRQVAAVKDVLSASPGRPWRRMVDEIDGHEGTAVVSMEFLGPAGPDQVDRVVGAFGGGAVVDVVVTARDLNRSVASLWQETIQNGRSWGWDEYVADVAAKRPGRGAGVADRVTAGGTFWRQQHLPRVVDSWSRAVGHDHVQVVTVPGPGAPRDTLAHRFGEVLGVAVPVHEGTGGANASLGLTSTLVLQRVNRLLDAQGLTFPTGARLRKQVLAKTVLAARRAEEPRLGLPVAPWVVEQAADTVAVLRDAGTRLVGSWEDLTPVEVPGVHPSSIDAVEVGEAALVALAGLVASQVVD